MTEPTNPPTPNPNRRAHIHNAITKGLNQAGERVPLSVRAAATRAVLAEVDAWHAQEEPPAAEVLAVIEEALRDSIDAWWQTPPRLDWAAAAVHTALTAHGSDEAEEDVAPTWRDRADHATQLYARTAIERDDAQAEVRRLRAERDELIRQRDQIAMDTIKAIDTPADQAAVRTEFGAAGRTATAHREGDYGEELTSREIRDTKPCSSGCVACACDEPH